MKNLVSSKLVSHLRKSVAVSCLALASSFVLISGAQSSEPEAEKHIGYTLSGTYLAARIATIDKNTDAAVDYYRQAMKFDPKN